MSVYVDPERVQRTNLGQTRKVKTLEIATAVTATQHNLKQAFSISAVKKAVEHEEQLIQMIAETTGTPAPTGGRGKVVDTYA